MKNIQLPELVKYRENALKAPGKYKKRTKKYWETSKKLLSKYYNVCGKVPKIIEDL